MISPISNQSNNKFYYNNKSQNPAKVNFVTENIGTSFNADISDYLQITKEQNDKKNKLLFAGIFSMLLSAGIIGISVLASKGHSRSTTSDSKVWSGLAEGFASLKENKEIPTLNECKSVNKKLKKFLQAQIDYAKVKPDDIKKLGTPEPAKRLLLYGPPGTGKSYFAKIYAKSLDAEYTEVKFSDFNSTWSGQHIEQFTSIFEDIIANAQAEPNKKFVVVFNEIDAIVMPANALRKASSSHSMFKLEERSVFLNCIDEIAEKTPNVTIIGTTNIAPKNNNLDGAAMSRFKNIIGIDYPETDCLFEACKALIEKMDGGKDFIGKNEKELKDLSKKMYNRKASFRDVNKIIDSSKNEYLQDYVKDNKAKFKFKYLENAFKELDLTDGEICGAANALG